jgi:alpha-L-rhamnosidase
MSATMAIALIIGLVPSLAADPAPNIPLNPPSKGGLSADAAPVFHSAKPGWLQGRETEMNLSVGLRAGFDKPASGKATLRITASTLYRCFLNGEFVGHGPARGPHGFYRVDEWDLSGRLRDGQNVVALEVAGYNANSYYLLDQPAFVQAEVVCGDKVLASTLGDGALFEVRVINERVQKVQRYSFQRPFIEVYRLRTGWDAWRSDLKTKMGAVPLTAVDTKALLSRRVALPEFPVLAARQLVATGTMTAIDPGREWKDRSLVDIGEKLKGYPEKDLELVISRDLQRLKTDKLNKTEKKLAPADPVALKPGEFGMVDFGANRTGFLRFSVRCAAPVRLYATFDETFTKDDVDWKRLGCVNALTYDLEPGDYALEGFEPNTMRAVKFIALNGGCEIRNISLRLYENPDTARATFEASDPGLNELFEAARSTFAQNAADVFMDCPHRERAGWLCDSFFTARSAMRLSGDTRVEKNMFENFLLPKSFAHLPQGMLPMCYPSDHYDGVYIPNWAMWFVMQLGEYSDRSGDQELVDALKPKVMALLDFFKKYENSDGLLEKLPSWVFVEWSKANDLVQDVNYPSNMLYAGVLDTAGRLYGVDDLREKAMRVRGTVRDQSLKAEPFFCDNAVRKDGKLELSGKTTEVCQYYAFYFDVATKESDAELWRILTDEFGPNRVKNKVHPEVYPANSFIGNMLRMELLSNDRRSAQIMDESIGYLKYMADRTGTLWENVQDNASLNHGFASHEAVTLQRDVLGLRSVDPVKKSVEIYFADVPLQWCRGTVPAGTVAVSLDWKRDGATVIYKLDAPRDWTVSVDVAKGLVAAAVK